MGGVGRSGRSGERKGGGQDLGGGRRTSISGEMGKEGGERAGEKEGQWKGVINKVKLLRTSQSSSEAN